MTRQNAGGKNKSCAGLAPNSASSNSTRNGALKICSKFVFSCGLNPKPTKAAQADVLRRARESLHMGGVDGGLADFLEVGRMAQPGQRMPVEQFKTLDCRCRRPTAARRPAG